MDQEVITRETRLEIALQIKLIESTNTRLVKAPHSLAHTDHTSQSLIVT